MEGLIIHYSLQFFFFITVWIVLCTLVASYAKKKGHSYSTYFILSICLSPLLAWVILLLVGENKEEIEKQQMNDGELKKCPFCAELIKSEAKVCRYCGRELPEVKKENDNTGFRESKIDFNKIDFDKAVDDKVSSGYQYKIMNVSKDVSNYNLEFIKRDVKLIDRWGAKYDGYRIEGKKGGAEIVYRYFIDNDEIYNVEDYFKHVFENESSKELDEVWYEVIQIDCEASGANNVYQRKVKFSNENGEVYYGIRQEVWRGNKIAEYHYFIDNKELANVKDFKKN